MPSARPQVHHARRAAHHLQLHLGHGSGELLYPLRFHALKLTPFSACPQILAGFLADRLGPVNTLFLSFFLGGLLQLVFWPYANTFGSITAFAALEGLTGSWFMVRYTLNADGRDTDLDSPFGSQSLIPVAAAQLFGLEGLATIVGFTVLANSPGQMLGATISGFVLQTGRGSNYAGVAYYAGSAMCGGAVILLWGEHHAFRLFERSRLAC